MTSRQTISATQRNSHFKVQPTVVSGRKALVVKLDWTNAPVVKTTIRRDFKLSIVAMDTQKWTPIQRGLMTLKAGQVAHFTQSSEHAGWYYVTIVGESCTCTAGLFKQECHHQTDAASFEARRTYRQVLPIFFQQIAMWATLSFDPISREIQGDRTSHAAYWTARNAYGDYRRAHAEMFVIPPPITVDDLGALEAAVA